MNFLLRPAQTAAATAAEQPSVSSKYMTDANYASKDGMTLGGLMAEDTYPRNSKGEDQGKDPTDGIWVESGSVMGASSKSDTPIVENHIDVAEDEGWITVPYRPLVQVLLLLLPGTATTSSIIIKKKTKPENVPTIPIPNLI
ncbi:hypothetical protein RHGRI_002304 [Rhododendron griersonianum]|uniref:Uncharacterized protein n=1 Tax=Rhododendron griersonianum TaxID=479676 RepID=A0AAV6LR23_9ERIC|nr:hypothetical protein RHGRI_002304 [Rhododendron griersonianum]